MLTKEEKAKIMAEYGRVEKDTGSPEVQIALLTIYDMCKAISKEMEIKDIHLLKKTGGKSGEFNWQEK